jgi:hypothetical protein
VRALLGRLTGQENETVGPARNGMTVRSTKLAKRHGAFLREVSIQLQRWTGVRLVARPAAGLPRIRRPATDRLYEAQAAWI